MAWTTFPLAYGENTRSRKVCWLISLLLHGIALGALGMAIPANFAPPDNGVTIDLEMLGKAPSENEARQILPQPEQAQNSEKAEPEKAVDSMPEPPRRKAEIRKTKIIPKKIPASGSVGRQKTAPAGRVAGGSRDAASNVPAAPKVADSPPAPLGGASCPRPEYPELARKRGQEGTVNVRCQVDASGKVSAVALAKSSGFKLLDEAALKAVGKWKFQAARENGASVAGTVVVPVRFQLR